MKCLNFSCIPLKIIFVVYKRDKNAVTLKMSAKYRHAKTAQSGVLAYLGFIVAMILSRNDA